MRIPFEVVARYRVCWLLAYTLSSFIVAQLDACIAEENSTVEESPEQTDFFERHVRPLLVARCFECHGEKKQWAGLRLNSMDGLLNGGESGPAIVKFKPDESLVLQRVTSADAEERMPPSDHGPAITKVELDYLRKWIALGAPWPSMRTTDSMGEDRLGHWAFQPLQEVDPPILADDDFSLSPIDPFILNRLRESKLSPSTAADRRTFIRRVTYDLTGLAPTPTEVSDFLADQSSNAYEKLVDRLLDSPRYGEHWGRHWLDVARYSDTKGYVYDREEKFFIHSTAYRNWVVNAFNDNMPYNQFLLLQLAADQAEPKDLESLAAMGFLTLGRRFIGVTPDIIDDRIDIVGRGLMGLTIGCARCHDHKYDPIPTADYYSLYGVFQNSVESIAALPTRSDSAESIAINEELTKRKKVYREYFEKQKREVEGRLRNRIGDYLYAVSEIDKYPELTFNLLSGKDDILAPIVHQWETYLSLREKKVNDEGSVDPIFGYWNALAKIPPDRFELDSKKVFSEFLVESKTNPKVIAVFETPPSSLRDAANRYGLLFKDIASRWQDAISEAEQAGAESPQSLADSSSEELRQVIFSDGSPCFIPDIYITNTEWLWDTPTVEELFKKQREVERWIVGNPQTVPHALYLSDQKTLITPRVFKRGNPSTKGAWVPRQFLTVIERENRKPFSKGSGRLEMAQAIISPRNPLTVRVWVNRVWQYHFGKGFVTTPSDFGLRAGKPSHPELLDWLSNQFIKSGWDTKSLHRMILLSATYRQSSTSPQDSAVLNQALKVDPENRLIWRMNSRRLAFEEIRDSMLQASGELRFESNGKPMDIFAVDQSGRYRRTIYSLIDRQYLATVLNVFDFANPDLHSPQRSETTIPQQALFELNHSFVAGRVREIVRQVHAAASERDRRIQYLFQLLFQRDPSDQQMLLSTEFLKNTAALTDQSSNDRHRDWSYGYGALDQATGQVNGFERLPYSNATTWQGGPQLPDDKLGWVHIASKMIHAGNDKAHSAIRRWTAPESGQVSIRSEAAHEHKEGDGARAVIVSNRSGILDSRVIFNSRCRMDLANVQVEKGDTIDFVVELHESLNYEDLLWAPEIRFTLKEDSARPSADHAEWNAEQDFRVADSGDWGAWEQLVHVLVISNESRFLD